VNEPLVLYRLHEDNSTRRQGKMAEDEYYVLTKALSSDPALPAALGARRVQRWMADLALAGYANAHTDSQRARGYFREALGHSPTRLDIWAYWASTFLPASMNQSLRRLKQRLTLCAY
jgi:hypothetical protein